MSTVTFERGQHTKSVNTVRQRRLLVVSAFPPWDTFEGDIRPVRRGDGQTINSNLKGPN